MSSRQSPKSRQDEKYHRQLAGEFYVAAELQRRGVQASVTYGNAKQADVIAVSLDGSLGVIIEVKSTGQREWVVGATVPSPSDKPWVFVHIPDDGLQAPKFFVMNQRELCDLLTPVKNAYLKRYREKHGRDYVNQCVWNLSLRLAVPYKNNWDAILNQLT